jgi:ribulose 1,5-bisphosphate carboxylase large subunit-like protein
VHPNTGGQFSFSLDERQAINEDARTADLPFKPSFPMVGGGRGRSNISHLLDTYGPDTVLLLDADLYEHPDGPRAGAKEISEIFK